MPFSKKLILKNYDILSTHPLVSEYFEESGFLNLGLWSPPTKSQKIACEQLTDEVINRLEPNMNDSVLDVACGEGASTYRLTSHWDPSKITGININETQIKHARKRVPSCQFKIMSATQLELPDNSIDKILCIEAAFHFNTREAFLKEALRVLKPNGRLVLTDVIPHKWAARVSVRIPFENYVPDINAYRQLLEHNGFEVIDITDATEQVWPPFLANLDPFLKAASRAGRLKLSEKLFINAFWSLQRRGLKNYLFVTLKKPE